MSNWLYIPVTIHLESKVDYSTHLQAVSGVYIYDPVSHSYHILTVCNVPDLDRYKIKFTCSSLITNTVVTWFPLTIEKTVSIFNPRSRCDIKGPQKEPLIRFIEVLVQENNFKFKPGHSHQSLSITSFRLSKRAMFSQPLFSVDLFKPLVFEDSRNIKTPAKIKIQCCPFSLTNAPMFVNYQILGAVNYKLEDSSAFLTDTKYLEDSIGGVVTLQESTSSVGLISGSFSKLNGDGDLMLIISWNFILQVLGLKDIQSCHYLQSTIQSQIASAEALVAGFSSEIYDPTNSVVRICSQTVNCLYWGSGVVISPEWIITNSHVLKQDLLVGLEINVPSRPDIRISLSDVVIYQSPLVGFDLCFVKLREPNYDITPTRLASSISYSDPLYISQPVKTIGHGLFYSRHPQELKPFHSEGVVNTIRNTPVDIYNNATFAAMFIVSAGCWNGSSGGGIFNENDELVGIMTSNGKLSNGEILPNFTLGIPVTVIEKAFYMLLNGLTPVDYTSVVDQLWSLRNTHESRTIGEFTSKL
ncbi:hypothetical protein WICPIJ_009119 [Wickerhamomyces pijperi]|uniref:Serine protease n=1 Tax=Wickerhamomyces pijperi TaxID=599730 RepID=A0A9P8TEZ3_WICPI|nr:hypothetical protein WICPIJ_009119 [Wickerhamomyces pijperi]